MERTEHGLTRPDPAAPGPSAPAGMDRLDFLKKTGKITCAALAAGSLAWLAGCGGQAVTERQSPSRDVNAGAAEEREQQPLPENGSTGNSPSGSAPAVDCPFYNNGTCEKTGRECTNCIEDR